MRDPVPSNFAKVISNKGKLPSVTQLNSETIYLAAHNKELRTVRKCDTGIENASPTSSSTCGAGLLVCDVEDPTRLKAPWHSVSEAVPQCYDPSFYTCTNTSSVRSTPSRLLGNMRVALTILSQRILLPPFQVPRQVAPRVVGSGCSSVKSRIRHG
jgi:hypothetical protein